MCCIFSCFGWALDMIQRMITFMLACILCTAVCIGLVVAVAAGVAYGYNYSMAEFLTFTRQDVTVYMRRGQFYDNPDLDVDGDMFSRRSNDQDKLGLITVNSDKRNKSIDYQENVVSEEKKPLPDTWKLLKDTRKYAELLTKYTQGPTEISYEESNNEEDSSVVKQVQRISPNPLVHTTVILSGTSKILMRKFQTFDSYDDTTTEMHNEQMFYRDFANSAKAKSEQQFNIFNDGAGADSRRKTIDGLRTKYIPVRTWKPYPSRVFHDDRDDADEDSVVYKPV